MFGTLAPHSGRPLCTPSQRWATHLPLQDAAKDIGNTCGPKKRELPSVFAPVGFVRPGHGAFATCTHELPYPLPPPPLHHIATNPRCPSPVAPESRKKNPPCGHCAPKGDLRGKVLFTPRGWRHPPAPGPPLRAARPACRQHDGCKARKQPGRSSASRPPGRNCLPTCSSAGWRRT